MGQQLYQVKLLVFQIMWIEQVKCQESLPSLFLVYLPSIFFPLTIFPCFLSNLLQASVIFPQLSSLLLLSSFWASHNPEKLAPSTPTQELKETHKHSRLQPHASYQAENTIIYCEAQLKDRAPISSHADRRQQERKIPIA